MMTECSNPQPLVLCKSIIAGVATESESRFFLNVRITA
jgi:hypothetical protein